jgi:hypothetical protein
LVAEILLPRSEWTAKIMQKHPDILEMRERTRHLYGFPSFGRDLNAKKTEIKDTMSHSVVLQLIAQFFKEENMTESLKVLEEEAGFPGTFFTNYRNTCN